MYRFLAIVVFLISFTLIAEDGELVEYFQSIARPVESPSDLDALLDAVGDSRYVLLGEASHGTSEYYTWRAEISKRLIREKGFSFIAVEGDWSSAYEVNRYVKDLPGAGESARDVLSSFDRWPEWMWSNREVKSLIEWMRQYNMNVPMEKRVGFYGMDLYAMWASIREVIAYFDSYFPDYSDKMRSWYACLLPFEGNPQHYATAVFRQQVDCSDDVAAVKSFLRENRRRFAAADEKKFFNVSQNALIVKNAERHYRAMVDRGPRSWNYRVRNFKDTVERLMEFYGPDARSIVWAHNTHVGDARATPMAHQGMENIGYLIRQKHGPEDVFIVGFTTYRGSVLAGAEWGAPVEEMQVPEGLPGSYEEIFQKVGIPQALFIFGEEVPEVVLQPRGHRAKGVVYDPTQERAHYLPTILPQRYDALIYIEETSPLSPL